MIIDKTCSCSQWLKKSICVHSLAYSILYDLNWYGPTKHSLKARTFIHKTKREAKKGGRIKNAESALIRDD